MSSGYDVEEEEEQCHL
jgi:hypothetical protein